ncbi:hypothetical protein LSHI6S_04048 [Leifsonia shinshuensis]
MQLKKLRARAILGATALLTVAGGVVATSVPASAALTHSQHVGVLYTNKIYHYADSFGQIRHYVVAQGRTIHANWARPGVWSDQGLSYAGVTSYGVNGTP